MSEPFNPDDFDIEAFLNSVDFDNPNAGPDEMSMPEQPEDSTGEYVPVRERTDVNEAESTDYEDEAEVTSHAKKKKAPLGLRILRKLLVVLVYLLVVVVGSYFLASAGWNWANDLLALNKEDASATVTLEEEWFTTTEETDEEGNVSAVTVADMDEVADLLQEEGMISYKWLFKLFAAFTHKDRTLAAGTYELNTSMDYSALLRNMRASSGARATVDVMIPEGYTMDEVLQLLAANGVASIDDLREAAANYEFSYAFLDDELLGSEARLEGYLYPDTYQFYVDMDAATALARMLANFDSKFDGDMQQRAAELGYTEREILIIASIIEKETDGVDQYNIASVIYNRLKYTDRGTNGYLQMDSTVQYALEERKEVLSTADLEVESPYNTYINKGLPIGPICNPGMTALQAALYPEDTDYFYFVVGDDGASHFFNTFDEFMAFRSTQTGIITREEDEEYYVEG